MDLQFVDTTLKAIANFINRAKEVTNYYKDKSLTDVTKLTRVEPLTIISRDLINLDYMKDINVALLNIFAGYYLQAVSILTKINDVEVIKLLDKLNPDRDETGFLLSESVSRESISNLLIDNYKYKLPSALNLATEAEKGFSNAKSDEVHAITEISNLSVGKLININIAYNQTDEVGMKNDNPKSVSIPISIRLMVSALPVSTISKLMTSKTEEIALAERYHAWRSGRINFISDLIFCQDLIDEHKKATISDDSGTLQEISRRVSNAKKYGLLTKNPSLVSASNIYIISEEIARDIESKFGGKLSSPRTRDKLFEHTYAMIIAVVDREWERVTFYSRGISSSTDLSIKEIKQAAKGSNGVDIMDILKSFNNGMAPNF